MCPLPLALVQDVCVEEEVVWWWCTLLVPALRTQKPTDLCDFQASLDYKGSFLIARAPQRNPVLKKQPTIQPNQVC